MSQPSVSHGHTHTVSCADTLPPELWAEVLQHTITTSQCSDTPSSLNFDDLARLIQVLLLLPFVAFSSASVCLGWC